MIVTLVNKRIENDNVLFDASFDENEEMLLRLGGIIFETNPTTEEIQERILSIINANFQDTILENIKII